MKIQSAMLWSDWLMWILVLVVLIAFFIIRRKTHLREPWRQIVKRKLGMVAIVILLFYALIGLLDCIHLQITTTSPQTQHISIKVKSVLDLLLGPLSYEQEKTYSEPFSTHLYTQSLVTLPDGKEIRAYPRLKYAGAELVNPATGRLPDIIMRSVIGFSIGLVTFLILLCGLSLLLSRKHDLSFSNALKNIIKGKTQAAWREAMITFAIIWLIIWVIGFLASGYHVLGTDKIGQDVLYQTLKSIRTGLIIGTLTTLFMLPFALILGTMAGYFRGWVDDIIQYLYTTLSSIPGVLLISATILVLQVYITNHPNLFPTLVQRADARLLALCLILGITSWASLCRLLRGETLKLRELEFIEASKALGVKNRKIIFRHIIPNVMHIVIITLVLDFSTLVLAEAVLSYVGVGVDPTTMSWGNIINCT